MPPLEPIPETVEAVSELDPSAAASHLLTDLTRLANRAQDIVPDLVGVSIGRLAEGLTFTLVASEPEAAVLDAIQYLAGGPCVDGTHGESVHEYDSGDPLDEHRWQLFAEATAARSVRSTLTLPVMRAGAAVGTVNLYAGASRAFVGQHDQLAEVFGAWAPGAVANADMSFRSRIEAERAPERIRAQGYIDVAVGMLAERLGLGVGIAEDRLREAAARAGVTMAEVAEDIVRLRDRSDRDDD